MPKKHTIAIEEERLTVQGRWVRVAKVASEHYDALAEPEQTLSRIRQANPGVDVVTFLQNIPDQEPRYPYKMEWDTLAVLPIQSYDDWWAGISCKTRNLVRKASKKGVVIRQTWLDEAFLRGVEQIYAESPVRQGKKFLHYGKDHERIRADLATFEGRSEFYGAYSGDELTGFIKFVEGRGFASLMHIFSSIASRDLSPTNALLDHAVSLCAQRRIPYLHYGDWARGGLGLFKRNHGFVEHRVPRYWVPVTWRGRIWLDAGCQQSLRERIPPSIKDRIVKIRGLVTQMRFGEAKPVMER